MGNWAEMNGWIKTVKRKNGRFPLLVLLIAKGLKPGEYVAMALEAKGPDVLESHAHKLLGVFKGKAKALKAANGFAKEWGKGEVKQEACDCGPIKQRVSRKRMERTPDEKAALRFGLQTSLNNPAQLVDCGHDTKIVYSGDNGKRFCASCYLDVFKRKCSQCGRAFGRDEIGCSVCK